MVNTSLNPDFFIPNFFRDLETAVPNLVGEQTMRDGLALKEVKGFKRKLLLTRSESKSGGLGAIGIFYKGFRNPEKLHPDDLRDFNEYIKTGAKRIGSIPALRRANKKPPEHGGCCQRHTERHEPTG